MAADQTRERVSVADLFEVMSHRAFGALILIFAAPNVLPMPPGFSTLFAAPLIFLATQLALSWPAPWLPKVIAKRSMPRADFAAIVDKASPWLLRTEKLLKPRLKLSHAAALRAGYRRRLPAARSDTVPANTAREHVAGARGMSFFLSNS